MTAVGCWLVDRGRCPNGFLVETSHIICEELEAEQALDDAETMFANLGEMLETVLGMPPPEWAPFFDKRAVLQNI